jgi:multidrug efflux system membrane fusion protein
MSTTQLSEQDSHAALPAPEPQKLLPSSDSDAPKGSGARKWIIVLIILLAVGAAIWKIRKNSQEQAAQSNKLAAAANRPSPVQAVPVVQKTMPIYLTALGTVTAYNTVTIKSRVDGQLIRVNVREGQAVKKGQLLLEIDPAPYLAAVSQAEGQLVKDQATQVNAQAEAARYTALYQAGVVSKESQQSQISTAGQAGGAIDADKAAIQAAKVNLAYTKITSPIDGVVGLRQVDPGNIVHAADTTGLIVVTQIHPIAVIFTLPEDQLPEVVELMHKGKPLTVEARDRSDTTHLATGSLLTLDNQIDTTTGTVKAKAVFDNPDGALFPNQFVNIRLILQDRPNALVVPAAAVQTGSQGTFVYVVKPGEPPAGLVDNSNSTGVAGGDQPAASGTGAAGGKKTAPYYVVAQPVKVDLTEGTQVILSSGVNPGDQVVVDGQEKLKQGAKVIPRAPQPKSKKGSGDSVGTEASPTPGTDVKAAQDGGDAGSAPAAKGTKGNGRQGQTR